MARKTGRIVLLCLPVFAPIASGSQGGCYVTTDSGFLKAGNDHIELVLRIDNGGIYSIIDKATGTDVIKDRNAWWSLYDFCFTDGSNPLQYVSGADASNFSYHPNITNDALTLEMTWSGFHVDKPRNFDVTVTITIPRDSALTRWTMIIANHESVSIKGVDFPPINGWGQISQNPLNDYLQYPAYTGLLFRDPVHNFKNSVGWVL